MYKKKVGMLVMSRVIYFGVDLHGHVNCSIGLVKKLVEKGEEVTYYCSDQFRDKIEGTGAKFKSYRGLLGFGTYDGNGIDTFLMFADYLLEKSRIIMDELIHEIEALKPDYIIHDAFCYWGKEVSKKLGIPGISLTTHYPFIDEMSNIDPKLFMETILRADNEAIYRKYRGKEGFYRKLMDKTSKMMSKKYNLEDANVINDIFGSKEKLNIIFSSRKFQLYSEAFDDSYVFAGYSINPRVEEADFPYEKLSDKPLIYIAFGTIFNETLDIYRNCIEAFGDTENQVVLSIGKNIKVEDLGYIPDNFIIRSYVPQLEILKYTDVFVSHGGTNSVYEAICMEVPFVIIPQSFDQFMGGRMIEEAEIGIYIGKDKVGTEQLKDAVNKVLTDEKYKNNSKKIRESLDATGGLDYAVNRIFEYIGQKP
jgi:MGT family glycosyltransferase